MPAINVSLDSKSLATVNTEGYDVLSIRVSGVVIDEEIATLECSGGAHPAEGERTHFIWIQEHPVRPGQLVEVSLHAAGATSHRGQTIEELYPGEPATPPADFKPAPEMLADLRSRPRFREKYSFRVTSANGRVSDHQTAPGDHGFAFSLVWNSFHPERARVSLHSYTLDNLESRGPMHDHFEQRLQVGEAVRFQLL